MHAADGVAPGLDLGVDDEVGGFVFLPCRVDLGLEVVVEEVRPHDHAGIGTQSPEVMPILVLDHQPLPTLPIRPPLRRQLLTDGIQPPRRQPRNPRDLARLVLQDQLNAQAHKVDIRHIDVQLLLIPRKLAEPPVGIIVGIRRVQRRGLHDGRPRVEEERQRPVLAEPDAGAEEVRDVDGARGRGPADGDGAVDGERLQDRGWGRRTVGRGAVGAEDEDALGVAAGDVRKEVWGVGVVFEDDG